MAILNPVIGSSYLVDEILSPVTARPPLDRTLETEHGHRLETEDGKALEIE